MLPVPLVVSASTSFENGGQGLVTRPTLFGIIAFGEELAQHAVQAVLDKFDRETTRRIAEVLPCPFIERESSRVTGAWRGLNTHACPARWKKAESASMTCRRN